MLVLMTNKEVDKDMKNLNCNNNDNYITKELRINNDSESLQALKNFIK